MAIDLSKKKNIFGILLIVLAGIYYLFFKNQGEQRLAPEVSDSAVVPALSAPPVKPQPVVAQAAPAKPSTPPAAPEEPKVSAEVASLRQGAKTTLSGAYTAQVASHAEYGRYSTDFHAFGYQPVSDGAPLSFKVGFLKPYFPKTSIDSMELTENPESMTSDTFMNVPVNITNPEREKPSYTEAAKSISLSDYSKYCKMGCTADEDEFEMLLVMPIGNGKKDVWLLNNSKHIELVCDGLKTGC